MRFSIWLRDDDAPYLHEIVARTGLGILRRRRVTVRAKQRHPGTKPQLIWKVETKRDCGRLVVLLDEHPPSSKKASDYAIWREAVREYSKRHPDWSRMKQLRRQLIAVRRYEVSKIPAEKPVPVGTRQLTLVA